ncbi:hypothetical protein FJTKL_10673 [Diaporthe vaccinii]|uniref:Uncharacterized protein n=1 Tax=Diaporthe vaccinii TaxID=105482 RepID=A0ABR4FBE9_9PEZI
MCFINKETIREICSQLIDPVFNAVKTCQKPPSRDSTSLEDLVGFREICTEQRPNRLLRMQDPFPKTASFSKEVEECFVSCRLDAFISPPPDPPPVRSASPSVAPPCAREPPWSSHAWRPSPP